MTPNVEFTKGSNEVRKRVSASKKPTIPQALLDDNICLLLLNCPAYFVEMRALRNMVTLTGNLQNSAIREESVRAWKKM